uniref:Packaging protein UL32 n=1 Tax=Otarine gammaherpesvirus 4 TaxID=2801541 RepID=A0A889IW41_9GAMA|nr:hypothetical protein [Otarine gammaherpesvirus 4]
MANMGDVSVNLHQVRAGCDDFVPWRESTLRFAADVLRPLLEHSFYPMCLETALDNPALTHAHMSLGPAASCRVCRLLHLLVQTHAPSERFYENYALLCYVTVNAPRCWLSTLMAAADLAELIRLHFPNTPEAVMPFGPGRVMGVDVLMHFFIRRCHRHTSDADLLPFANLCFMKTEFMRGALTGTLCSTMCFRTLWGGAFAAERKDKAAECCNVTRGTVMCTSPSNSHGHLDDHESQTGNTQHVPYMQHLPPSRAARAVGDLLSTLWETWHESDLFSDQFRDTLHELAGPGYIPFHYSEDVDVCQGPCLLAPTLHMHKKNHTSSVCVPCECLAAHPEGAWALERLRADIIDSFDNNVGLIDRIAFLLCNERFMPYLHDERLRATLRQCTPQELHKHLFCDPQCALNTHTTKPEVLFGGPVGDELCRLKAALAAGVYTVPPNDKCSVLDCEPLDTLVLVFKACQHCKVGKITQLEVVRELDHFLHRHGLAVVHALQTARVYT